MAKKSTTLTGYQRLNNALSGNWGGIEKHTNSYKVSSDNRIFRTTDKDEYEAKKLELAQSRYLAKQWVKTNRNLDLVEAFKGKNNMLLMYTDADFMDSAPEIASALDTISEESTVLSDKGKVITVKSESNRIKAILEDLFENRLDMNIMAPLIVRGMCKYGNQFMLLDIDKENGVKGWRQLPVGEVERIEHGIDPMFLNQQYNSEKSEDMSTKFRWVGIGQGGITEFRNWQVAHFRLITNSMYLPYGVSWLNPARRHFRMLCLMEDMMLIYRLERSMERRVFKIFVGAMDDADIPSYMDEIANNFKRTPIVDPLTGLVDLRKNVLPVHKDTPIPLLDGRTITIEELANEFDNGVSNYVYSIQDETKKIVPGLVKWCGKNYTAEKLYKITLDDNSYTVMAGEHEVIMRDGTKKRADMLCEGESVMPFYHVNGDGTSKKWGERYDKVYNPNSGKYEHTHRLIAESNEKLDDKHNTVHHIDFNKYNNRPDNLMWCDFHEHHKMHSELSKKTWEDKDIRERRIRLLSESAKKRFENGFDREVAKKIRETLRKRYQNGELEYLREKTKETLGKWREEHKDFFSALASKNNHERGYVEGLRRYNESELHKEHNKIRSECMKLEWEDEAKRTNRTKKMTTFFDDYVWCCLRDNIISKKIVNRKTMLEYINENLIEHLIEINNSKKLSNNKKISREIVETRIHEIGFKTITEYIGCMKKNHKISKIEIIGGDDVYCMTVVGPNNEEDRHNFALRSINNDGSWNDNGIFVSNCTSDDFFIPVRDQSAPSPIETLAGANNLTALDDIKYVQNKVYAGLCVPKQFISFEETTGDGKNLALMDVRFARKINRVQQSFLMELNKIAILHLYILGFHDEISNFKLSMKNPSTQAEMMNVENLAKKISAVRDAVTDPGGGIPILSMKRAVTEFLGFSEKEWKNNLEEIRLEKALAKELEKTDQIIQRSGIFDIVDRIYGEPGAKYAEAQGGQEGGDPMGGGPGGGGGGFGGGLDSIGDMGGEPDGDVPGMEGEMPAADMGGESDAGGAMPADAGGAPPMEGVDSSKPLIDERGKNGTEFKLGEGFIINKNIDDMIRKVDEYIEK